MDIVNMVLVQHENACKPYLFRMPNNKVLLDGDFVSVQRRNGRKGMGTVTGSNFYASLTQARVLTRACGGYWPLASVTGVYREERFECST